MKIILKKDNRIDFLILYKHFLKRFIKNDLINDDSKLLPKIVLGIAVLITISGFISIFSLQKYLIVPNLKPYAWVDLSTLILLSFIATGLISILEWKVIFLDRTDYAILKSLPVKTHLILLAKLTSVFTLIILTTATVSIIPVVLFPMFLADSFLLFFSSLIINITGFMFSNIFIFFSISIINLIIYSILPSRIYRTVSFLLQIAMIVMLMLIAVFPVALNDTVFEMMKSGSPKVIYFPHLWFIGIIEWLKGVRTEEIVKLAKTGIISLICLIVVYFFFLLRTTIGYGKNSGKTIAKKSKKRSEKIIDLLFLRNPIEKALFVFLKNSLFSVDYVRMSLAFFIAFGLGIISVYYLNIFLLSELNTLKLIEEIFFISNTIIYFLIFGIQTSLNKPLELNSSWIIKITERKNKKKYISGLRKSLLILIVVPVIEMIFIPVLLITNIRFAILHSINIFGLSILLYELFFINFHKFPFACNEIPFSNSMMRLWMLKLIGFALYIKIASIIENLFTSDIYYTILFIIGILIIVSIKDKLMKTNFDFIYNIDELEVFQTLQIDNSNFD